MARFLALLALAGVAQAQVPIPTRPDGFVFGKSGGAVVLEGFFDLMCPDCKAAWPVVKQVAEHYGSEKLEFRFHTFPLPYHHNSYFANQAAHVIAAKNASAVYTWLEAVFAAQDGFGNSATAAVTPEEVMQAFGGLAEKTTGVSADVVTAGLQDPDFDWDTRVSWKYGCSRSVSGTPTFLVNGVQVAADPSWTEAQWYQLLDPLFAQKKVAVTDCTAGQKVCEYLPGKSECCLDGEFCIPNVGCRCALGSQGPCRSKEVAAAATNCTAGQKVCEYLPGKSQCCLDGEFCIPNVGCTCAFGAQGPCRSKEVAAVATNCTDGQKVCEYLPGKTECCLNGEYCIPNVGCRCAQGAKGACRSTIV